MDDLIIGMAGAGGDGILSAGESLINAAAQDGYFGILTKSFGSQIRGGESSCRLRLSTRPVLNPGGALDVAVVLNWEDFLRFGSELAVGPHSVVIFEAKSGIDASTLPLGVRPALALAVPIGALAVASAGVQLAKNNVVLGLLAGWFGFAQTSLLDGIRKKFARKGDAVLQGNERAFAAGLEYATQHPIATTYRFAPAKDTGT